MFSISLPLSVSHCSTAWNWQEMVQKWQLGAQKFHKKLLCTLFEKAKKKFDSNDYVPIRWDVSDKEH